MDEKPAPLQLGRHGTANIGGLSSGLAVATAESGLRMKTGGTHALLKVAFDASALKPQYNHHGIQVYTRNLLAALQRIAGPGGMEIRPFLPSAEDSTATANTAFICNLIDYGVMAVHLRLHSWMAPISC